jgi:hypothetical protein
MTDPETFHRMLSLDSPRIYLLMGATVAVAFVGARLLRGRRALLTGDRIDWSPTRPTGRHVAGSVLFGIGWGIAEACPARRRRSSAPAASSPWPSPPASSPESRCSRGSRAPRRELAAGPPHRQMRFAAADVL